MTCVSLGSGAVYASRYMVNTSFRISSSYNVFRLTLPGKRYNINIQSEYNHAVYDEYRTTTQLLQQSLNRKRIILNYFQLQYLKN